MLLRKCLLILGLATTLNANAGLYEYKSSVGDTRCQIADVTLPCIRDGYWAYGIDALYLKHTNSYLTTFQGTGPQFFNFDASWGYLLEAAYHFGTGNDFNINWTYYTQQQDMAANGPQGPLTAGAFNERNRMSVLNAELGQEVDFGEKWYVRMHAGLQYASFSERYRAPGGALLDRVEDNMIGPRAGLNIAFKFTEAWAFYTNGALGALYDNAAISSGAGGVFAGSNANVANGVVEVDYDIGFQYLRQAPKGDFLAKIAWTSYNYQGFAVASSGLAWQGLLLGMKWIGNA